MITALRVPVTASDSAYLYVIVSPTGPYLSGESKGISLLAISDVARTWPGEPVVISSV
jgi:branched-chain amino acid aminotransferase